MPLLEGEDKVAKWEPGGGEWAELFESGQSPHFVTKFSEKKLQDGIAGMLDLQYYVNCSSVQTGIPPVRPTFTLCHQLKLPFKSKPLVLNVDARPITS